MNGKHFSFFPGFRVGVTEGTVQSFINRIKIIMGKCEKCINLGGETSQI